MPLQWNSYRNIYQTVEQRNRQDTKFILNTIQAIDSFPSLPRPSQQFYVQVKIVTSREMSLNVQEVPSALTIARHENHTPERREENNFDPFSRMAVTRKFSEF